MARKLTARTALWKARGLFGDKATASVTTCHPYNSHKGERQYMSCAGIHEMPCPMGRPVYQIGRVVLGMFNEIRGSGRTWEEALEKAAKNVPLGG